MSTEISIPSGNRGLQLSGLEDYWRFSQYVAESGLAPKGMEKPASILVALQMGAELGLTPMASLQNIAVINGRPSVWGDSMLAVCRASGVFDEDIFEEKIVTKDGIITATCTVRRLPNGKPVTREFSMNDAKSAGLVGKAGPWTQYPKRMLQMRARSWALRDTFTDALKGVMETEEAMDAPRDRVIDSTAKPAGLKDEAEAAKRDMEKLANAKHHHPGDDIAADAAGEVAEQTVVDAPTRPQRTQGEWIKSLQTCDSIRDAEFIGKEAQRDGWNISEAVETQKGVIRSSRGQKANGGQS